MARWRTGYRRIAVRRRLREVVRRLAVRSAGPAPGRPGPPRVDALPAATAPPGVPAPEPLAPEPLAPDRSAPDALASGAGTRGSRVGPALAGRHGVSLRELLPDGPLGTGDAADGLTAVVGRAGDVPVTLTLGEPFRHWLIGGRRGFGTTVLLHSLLYGLASRYAANHLAVYLLDPAGDGSWRDLPAALPQVRAVGGGDRVTAVLEQAAAASAEHPTTRVVCAVNELGALAPADLATLCDLAGDPAADRVHLIAAGEDTPPAGLAAHCRVRIAFAGGRVLDPANDAADGLPHGRAVVNTAAGLGGPRGAVRAHEQIVSVCDPYTDPAVLAGLRDRLACLRGGA
jgi:DNA segregation ATPase FtsK/SpoIIIE, S-DNA-T family